MKNESSDSTLVFDGAISRVGRDCVTITESDVEFRMADGLARRVSRYGDPVKTVKLKTLSPNIEYRCSMPKQLKIFLLSTTVYILCMLLLITGYAGRAWLVIVFILVALVAESRTSHMKTMKSFMFEGTGPRTLVLNEDGEIVFSLRHNRWDSNVIDELKEELCSRIHSARGSKEGSSTA